MAERPEYRQRIPKRSERKGQERRVLRQEGSHARPITDRAAAFAQVRGRARNVGLTKPAKGRGQVVALVLLGVAVVLIVGVAFSGWYLLGRSPGPKVASGKQVAITIPEGAGVAAIADILVERGIVKNPLMFKIMVRLKGGNALFRAGRYLLVTGSGYEEAIAILSAAPPAVDVTTVTIIEGQRIDAVSAAIAEKLDISADEFAQRASDCASDYAKKYPYLEGAYDNSLEGFLFPDTYEFAINSTCDEVIERMLSRFDEVWKSLGVSKERLGQHDVAQLVTIASLCEREASLDEERPLVASVIENRLDIDMRLQFCSTVQFLLPPDRLTDFRLTDEDTRIDSPYNTYVNYGLPPGPICSPSRASLEAAVKPANTGYYYFVLTGKDGSQTFSRTLDEHNAAVQLSLQVFGQ